MPSQNLDLFVVAAEPSADKHGYEIIFNLLKKNPQIKIGGVLGPKLRTLALPCYLPMEKLQVMGFIDVFFALPKIIYRFFSLRNLILKINPHAILFIDYPEFNLRLERSLKKKNFCGKIFHHICPTIWAWAKGRLKIMEEAMDQLFVIFPFEKAFLQTSPLNVEYVGHPLFEKILHHSYDPYFLKKMDILSSEKILGIFPGSRVKEILRNLPLQLKIAELLKNHFPHLKIVISISDKQVKKPIEKILKKSRSSNLICVEQDQCYDLMANCEYALATSGTVTLELAFHEVPTVVTFGIQLLDLLIAQKFLKIDLPFFCIVNIICQKPVFPELFGPNLTEKKLFYWAKRIIEDKSFQKEIIHNCQSLRELFANKSPKLEIAEKILSIFPINL